MSNTGSVFDGPDPRPARALTGVEPSGPAGARPRNGRAEAWTRDEANGAPALPIAILGVPFDPMTMEEALARIEAMIASRVPHQIVTANVDFLAQARRDAELRRILLDADLVLCDGTPLLWASRWLGNPLPERVAGSDLAPRLMENAARQGRRVYFLGGAPGTNAQAVARARARFPKLAIAGHYSPPFRPLEEMDHEDIVRRIRAARPDILLVSLGCPKAEKWIAAHLLALEVPVVIGVGATIDFLAGRIARAPRWMQRCGAEWVFRLWQEPRRLAGRYARDLWCFGGAILAQWGRLQFTLGRAEQPFPSWRALFSHRCQRIEPGERIDRATIARHHLFWESLREGDGHCLLDLSRVRFIDSTGVAVLLHLRKSLQARARRLVLLSVSGPVLRALRAMRLEEFFDFALDALDARRFLDPPRLTGHAPPRNGRHPAPVPKGEAVAATARSAAPPHPNLRVPRSGLLPPGAHGPGCAAHPGHPGFP